MVRVTFKSRFSPKKVPIAKVSDYGHILTQVLNFLAALIIKAAFSLQNDEKTFLNCVHVIHHYLDQVFSLFCNSVSDIALSARMLTN
jgi:hypothetical protein